MPVPGVYGTTSVIGCVGHADAELGARHTAAANSSALVYRLTLLLSMNSVTLIDMFPFMLSPPVGIALGTIPFPCSRKIIGVAPAAPEIAKPATDRTTDKRLF
jgi:hypothetical protein